MNIDTSPLFGVPQVAPVSQEQIKVLPVSVIDIAAQKKRVAENHASTSSRANYSPFPSEVSDLCYQFFLRDSENIVDPFAGWGERHAKALEWNKQYTGFDCSPTAIKKAHDEYGVDNTLADSLTCTIPKFDGLLTCPPYWNLERYSPQGIDAIKDWDGFLCVLQDIFSRFYMAADDGSTFCVMVGDWRKKHKYYDLTFSIEFMFNQFGAEVVDKVTISRKKVSKIKIMLPQAKRLGYTVRVHESLLVFRKPEASDE
jgi:hypothetical protein